MQDKTYKILSYTFKEFLFLFAELSILLILVNTFVHLLLYYIPQEKISKKMTQNGLISNFLAAGFGLITPFCSCSTIPIAAGFIKMKIPFSSIITFILASPLLDPVVLVMITTLVSFKAAIIYFIVTFFTSILFGIFLEKIGGEKYVIPFRITSQESFENVTGFGARLKTSILDALANYKGVFFFLLLGAGIGSMIHHYIPSSLLSAIASHDNLLAVPIAAVIGIPLYLRAEVAIPIGLALSAKGVGLGTIFAMIIGGAGMSIPELFLLTKLFKKQVIFALVIEVFFIAVICGYLLNYFL